MKKLLLSLGALTAVVAPVAAVVACGNTKELGIEKKDAIGDVEFYNFPAAQAQEFLDRIDHAKSTDEVSNILKEVDAAGKIWEAQGAKLDTPKNEAIGEIKGLTNLDQDTKDKYLSQINKATTEDEINAALKAAEADDNKLEVSAEVIVAINGRVGEYEAKKDLYLKRDYDKWMDEIKAATSYAELNAAAKSLDATINSPKIYKAVDGDFEIELDNGKFLYFAKDATEATWTDMSDPKQPVTTFKRTGLDGSGIPTLEVFVDGSKTTKSYVIQPVDTADYGLVLEDMSGAYHIKGVKDEADFIKNLDVIAFIERSIPVLDSKTEEPENIEGMLTVVDALQNPSATYTHVRLNADNTEIELTA